jgi:hypothetical protein
MRSGSDRSSSRDCESHDAVISSDMSEKENLREPVKKQVGGTLSRKSPLERLAFLQRSADAVLGRSWRGKDDGTPVRKVVGKTSR